MRRSKLRALITRWPRIARAMLGGGVNARIRRVREPVPGLSIEIFKISEDAAHSEMRLSHGGPCVRLCPWLRGRADAMGFDGEAVVMGQVGKQRVQCLQVQPDLLYVVAKDLASGPTFASRPGRARSTGALPN